MAALPKSGNGAKTDENVSDRTQPHPLADAVRSGRIRLFATSDQLQRDARRLSFMDKQPAFFEAESEETRLVENAPNHHQRLSPFSTRTKRTTPSETTSKVWLYDPAEKIFQITRKWNEQCLMLVPFGGSRTNPNRPN